MRTRLLLLIFIFLCAPIIEAEIVIVMPFANLSASEGEQWLSQGVAIMITEELASNGINAISWKVLQQYRESLGIPAKVPFSLASAIKIAGNLGADVLIVGSYHLTQSDIKITAKAIDLQKVQYLCDISHNDELIELRNLIAKICGELSVNLPKGELFSAVRQKIPRENPPFEALKALIQGLEEKDFERRIEYLKAALKAYPGYLRANWELARGYFQQGDYINCEVITQKLASVSGYEIQANFLLSLTYYYQSRFKESIDILARLVNTLPTGQILNNLGLSFLQIGDFEKGLWYLEKAQNFQPEDTDYSFNLGFLYWKRKDSVKALEWLKKVVVKEPSFFQAHWLLSKALQSLGREEEAKEEYLLARGYAPGSAILEKLDKGQYPLERVKMDIDSISGFEGLQLYEQDNTQLKVELAEFYLKQGEIMFKKGEFNKALQELKKSVYLFPYSDRAHLLLAKIYVLQEKTAHAINELKMSIWSKENLQAHLELAKIYYKLEQTEKALNHLEQCLILQPGNQEVQKLKEKIISQGKE